MKTSDILYSILIILFFLSLASFWNSWLNNKIEKIKTIIKISTLEIERLKSFLNIINKNN